MTQKELAYALRRECPGEIANQRDAMRVVSGLFRVLAASMEDPEFTSLVIVKFGKFEVKIRPERYAKHPRTGEPITWKAKRLMKFIPCVELKDRINNLDRRQG